jgi:hypothetical protein
MCRAHQFKEENVVMDKDVKPRKWGVLILFASTTTLVCCALPILLVSLGMGAVAASLYGEYFPWLRWFGLHEYITFGVTAAILAIATWALYRPGRACPADPMLAEQCNNAHKWNIRFLWSSVVVWCIGAFSAFILPYFG